MAETNQKDLNSLMYKNKVALKAALFLFTHIGKIKTNKI
jgi:hypothetical protein